ncbi:Hypothetical protein, putative [Bodo saltans]|uniref:Uncharacterized protein n=1 Tax=Bodo saltans TaxID=75058 RepID=A0A0S4J5K2_BODSA|nr:Hypothetical protein, putative [Bodo saltans]|eukprot:CUG84361.1 Hypothetical protein, putative [Bodo saltans]
MPAAAQEHHHLQAIHRAQHLSSGDSSKLEYFGYHDTTRRDSASMLQRTPTQIHVLMSVKNLGQSLSPELINRRVEQLLINAYRCQSEADTPVAQYVGTLGHEIILSVTFPGVEGLSRSMTIRQFMLNTAFRFLMDADGYWSDSLRYFLKEVSVNYSSMGHRARTRLSGGSPTLLVEFCLLPSCDSLLDLMQHYYHMPTANKSFLLNSLFNSPYLDRPVPVPSDGMPPQVMLQQGPTCVIAVENFPYDILYGHLTLTTDVTNVITPLQWFDRLISISYSLWEQCPRCRSCAWRPETNTLEVQVVFPLPHQPASLDDNLQEFINCMSNHFLFELDCIRHLPTRQHLFRITSPRQRHVAHPTARRDPLIFTLLGMMVQQEVAVEVHANDEPALVIDEGGFQNSSHSG